MNDKPTTLRVKKVSTAPLKISIDVKTDVGRIKGHLTGHAILRSKEEATAFSERMNSGEFDTDIDLLKEMYRRIDGLADDAGKIEDDAVWDWLTKDPLGPFIIAQLLGAYFSQYNLTRVGN